MRGQNIRTYADGQLINRAVDVAPRKFYATASRDLRNGDIILKAVNFTSVPQTMQIELSGARGIGRRAVAQVLAGLPDDINSIENPRKIVPQNVTLTPSGSGFSHRFPAYSVTVARFKAQR